MANRRWHSDTLYNITVKLSVEYYKYVKINTYGIIYNILFNNNNNNNICLKSNIQTSSVANFFLQYNANFLI